jgi:hypothetical protein
MLRRSSLMRVVILAGLALVQAPAADAGDEVVTRNSFTTVVPWTPCTGEAVLVQGQARLVTHTVTDPVGGTHIAQVWASSQLTGVGMTTGTAYHGTDGATSAFVSTGPPQNTLTDTFHTILVGAGRAGNLLLTGVFHETVDATGAVTAQVDTFSATCTG